MPRTVTIAAAPTPAPRSVSTERPSTVRPALATRGLQVDDFTEIGQIMATALTPAFDAEKAGLAERVSALADRYPLYEHLGAPAAV